LIIADDWKIANQARKYSFVGLFILCLGKKKFQSYKNRQRQFIHHSKGHHEMHSNIPIFSIELRNQMKKIRVWRPLKILKEGPDRCTPTKLVTGDELLIDRKPRIQKSFIYYSHLQNQRGLNIHKNPAIVWNFGSITKTPSTQFAQVYSSGCANSRPSTCREIF